MDHEKLHKQKLFEIVVALQGHGLDVNDFHVKRMASLMRYHLVHHNISLSAEEAGNLLKLEIAEFIVKKHGPAYIHTMLPASLN